MRQLWIFAHLAGVIVWVGGMFFADSCMRPAALVLAPPQRLALISAALGRFFGYVLAALAAIWVSGIALIAPAGLAGSPPAWHAMLALGAVMTAIFAVIRVARYPALMSSIAAADWPGAAAKMNGIRRLVVANLALGVITVAVATLGRLV